MIVKYCYMAERALDTNPELLSPTQYDYIKFVRGSVGRAMQIHGSVSLRFSACGLWIVEGDEPGPHGGNLYEFETKDVHREKSPLERLDSINIIRVKNPQEAHIKPVNQLEGYFFITRLVHSRTVNAGAIPHGGNFYTEGQEGNKYPPFEANNGDPVVEQILNEFAYLDNAGRFRQIRMFDQQG